MTNTLASKPAKRTYWIAFTKDVKEDKYPVAHYGYTDPNQETISGQPSFEVFSDEKKWKDKIKGSFKIDPDAEISETVEEVKEK